MLVQPEQLYRWIEEKSVSVFDCRFSLQDKSSGKKQYDEAHIPGAFYLDLESDLSAPASVEAGRHPLPNPLRFAARMSELGAADEKAAVFYDDGEGMAARAWWLMRYIGHTQVYLLDGGLDRFAAEGYTVTDEVPVVAQGKLSVNLQEQMIADEASVEAIAAGQTSGILIDARANARYTGLEEPIDPKAGHIPSAKNAPWTEGTDADGRWLPSDYQRARFRDMSESSESIVHYCGSGVTACNNVFAMELAGIKGALLYPGSWSQWCNKPYHAVETDEA